MHNRYLITAAALLVVGLMSPPMFASESPDGRTLARQCSVCHGKNGLSKDPEVPNLAGQSAFYLEKSLKEYREGTRVDRRMTLIVQNLSDIDIKALSAWYESIEVTATVPEQ